MSFPPCFDAPWRVPRECKGCQFAMRGACADWRKAATGLVVACVDVAGVTGLVSLDSATTRDLNVADLCCGGFVKIVCVCFLSAPATPKHEELFNSPLLSTYGKHKSISWSTTQQLPWPWQHSLIRYEHYELGWTMTKSLLPIQPRGRGPAFWKC